ncbi:hypothetical protein GO495_28420 [Chitinophaga oryziterrae]|uniref:Fungal lipase-type domain-containing protein n=1 Tax=Chitinophaga oryziterrae TaxID=1031224 RepID=A0A6N8JH28_9BACT|nr:lipase family protein [Chitinophaga oryziterrae]MVT44553.1 hypothetical protein [Chitinophaga oryziterrae]
MAQNQSGQTTLAQTAVMLSAVTYSTDPQQDIDTLLPGWSIVWDGIQTSDGNYAFIATDPSEEYYALAVRGSLPPFDVFDNWDAFANWVLEDLDVITQVSWPYLASGNGSALISQGAYTSFDNVLNMQDQLGSGQLIFDYLKNNAVIPGKQIIITGHSLGGNIANVYASYFVTSIAQENYTSDNISLFTFAAPAAGNSDFATDLDNKISTAWHYENANDIVPKFPASFSVLLTAFLFDPAPSASEITVNYQGYTISLREAFILLSGVFYFYGYQQPSLNYTVFPNALDENYQSNTLEDWFDQAGAQHALSNYAGYLGVTLGSQLAKQSSIV